VGGDTASASARGGEVVFGSVEEAGGALTSTGGALATVRSTLVSACVPAGTRVREREREWSLAAAGGVGGKGRSFVLSPSRQVKHKGQAYAS
jgi:hypothetical protein